MKFKTEEQKMKEHFLSKRKAEVEAMQASNKPFMEIMRRGDVYNVSVFGMSVGTVNTEEEALMAETLCKNTLVAAGVICESPDYVWREMTKEEEDLYFYGTTE